MTSALRRRAMRRWIAVAVAVAAILVVVLVVLISVGVLVLPTKTSAPVTITSVELKVSQGTTGSGVPWFVPGYVNYTGVEGYPIQVAPGTSWTVAWEFTAFDSVNHTIYRVSPSAPFVIASTNPAVPCLVPADTDKGTLSIVVTAPSDPGATYSLTLTVDTLTPS
jgi:hypothetical protein